MIRHEYRYFVAAGRSLVACQEIRVEREAAFKALRQILAEVGADNAHGAPRIAGLTFPDGARPEGWRSYVRGYSSVLMPEKRNKALAALRARIEAIRLPGAFELTSRMGLDWCFTSEVGPGGSGNVILAISAETLGKKVILKVPVDREGRFSVPPDAKSIKASEYWRMKEKYKPTAPRTEPVLAGEGG